MPNEPVRQAALHKKHIARLERERRQTKFILYAFIGIVVAVILLLVYGYLEMNYFKFQQPVAKVGEKEISLKDFQARVRLERQQLLSQYGQLESLYIQYQQFAQATGMDLSQQIQQFQTQGAQIQAQLDNPEQVGQTVLNQMINEEIIRQESAKRGITVSEEELNKRIQSDFGYFPNGTPTPTTTPTQNPLLVIPPVTPSATAAPTFTFTPEAIATLEGTPSATELPATATAVEPSATSTPEATSTPLPTATPYTKEGFESLYKETNQKLEKLGFDYDIYRKLYETQILQEKLQKVVVTDAKPEEEQVHARHILVSDEVLAKKLIERLQNGENFGLLAMEYSSDTGSASSGGDLGWFGKGKMVPAFEEAAFALKNPGDFTTEPVKTDFGYHIIQLIERPYSPEQIQAAESKAFGDWLEKAKTEYGVQTFDLLWKSNIPTEPNLITAATEAAFAQQTAIAKEKESTVEPTATPK